MSLPVANLPVAGLYLREPAGPGSAARPPVAGEEFRGLVERFTREQEAGGVKLSSHARERLERRGIALSTEEQSRLREGVNALAGKGIRDGLVVSGDHRFVVSVVNRTVITVMGSKDREVFTNIDGVVFV